MRKTLTLLILLITFFIANGQQPGIRWTKYTNNTAGEFFYDIKPTGDNGYIGVGNDSSFGYDRFHILRKFFGYRALIVKMDSVGNVQWQKTNFGEGAGIHYQSVVSSTDGGYVAAGLKVKNSPFDSSNFYIIKYNSTGTVLWQKEYGGTKSESANCIIRTSSGGYVIAGYTGSNDGDVTGNHSPNLSDVWLMNTDASGNIIWKKCFGGSGADTAYAVIQTPDKGFVVAGSSASFNGNLTGNNGLTDAWLFKTDSSGNLLWQKNFGGSRHDIFKSIVLNTDDTYTLTGYTTSTGVTSNGSKGKSDLWIARIRDGGTLLWSKGFGGAEDEEGLSIASVQDGSYIVSGYTGSNTVDVSGNNGSIDAWVIKISGSGNLVWQKCVGTNREEIAMAVIAHNENDFTIGGLAQPSNYPSDYIDAYLVKLGNAAKFIGNIVFPQQFVSGGMIQLSKADGTQFSTIQTTSRVLLDVDTGSYTGTFTPPNNNYTVTPATFNANFPSYFDTLSMLFVIQAIPGRRDATINAVALQAARPGFDVSYRLFYKNTGTDTITNGVILFKKDSRLNLLSSAPAVSSINGDTLKWNYSNLKPFDSSSILINMQVQVPPSVNINDTLSSIAIFTPVAGDLTPSDDTSFIKQIVIGSYDPNDKTENIAGKITQDQVLNSAYIDYLVRFQNTGTDTAFTVIVRDTLDAKLDWSSLQMIASSHPYQVQIKSQNKIAWQFNNIKLPDSIRNEPGSHGFIAYRIKTKNDLALGDTIKNAVSIYFDYNLPVRTNTVNTIVVLPLPTITSFTPAIGGQGTSVTITGTNFTGTTAVSFGGVAATSFTVNSSTSITAIVANGASGNVSVTTPLGTATLGGFTFTLSPTINSFTPASGASGTSITITGANLNGATAVSFGGVAASFTVNSATSITAVVGTGASGNVSVTTPAGTASMAGFTFLPAPTITSFTPASGSAGTSITITGTNFAGATAVNFGGVAATSFTVNSATSITAVVGTGASGNVIVTTPGGTASMAGFTFTTVTGINGPSNNNSVELRIFPNPVIDIAVIKHPSTNKVAKIRFVDIAGRTVKVFEPAKNTPQSQVDLKMLPSGVYSLVWLDGSRILSRTFIRK